MRRSLPEGFSWEVGAVDTGGPTGYNRMAKMYPILTTESLQ